MKIRLVTNAVYPNGCPRFVVITDGTKARWCELNGWEYVRRSEIVHPENPPHWSKPRLLLDALDGCDWVVWMDCDAAILNLRKLVTAYLASVGDRIVMQKDHYGWNSGVFAVPRARADFLERVDELHDRPEYQSGFYEQQAMMDLLGQDAWSGMVEEPPRWLGWNSYFPLYHGRNRAIFYKEGDWVLHLPGVDDDLRDRIFSGIVCE